MREIDPIREPSEALLSSALRRLASAGDGKAPAEVERALLERFRQHHRRRRDLKLIAATAIAACLIVLVLLLNTQHAGRDHNSAKALVPRSGKGGQAESLERPGLAEGKTLFRHHLVQPARTPHSPLVADGDGFIALPSYDPAMASGELQLVRIELPQSDLRMLGAPIAGDPSDQPVTVDLIADRDGTPYAVRLVQ